MSSSRRGVRHARNGWLRGRIAHAIRGSLGERALPLEKKRPGISSRSLCSYEFVTGLWIYQPIELVTARRTSRSERRDGRHILPVRCRPEGGAGLQSATSAGP